MIIKHALQPRELPTEPVVGQVFKAPEATYILATRSIDVTINNQVIGSVAYTSPRPNGLYLFHCTIARELKTGTLFTLQIADLYYSSAVWVPDEFWAGTGNPTKNVTQEKTLEVIYVSDVQKIGHTYCYRELHTKEKR